MVKIVESGCRDCTVTLDGTECAVEFPANYRVFSAMNMSDSDIIMSVESGKTAADDGVRIVEAGGVGALNHMRSDINTVYITGTGKVQISAGNEAVLPFKSAAKGGENITVSACGNPVQLSGLQGGVPFGEISLSGENIIGQEITVSACGKNLISYPYTRTTETAKGVDFTDNGDGTITINGTATDSIWYTFTPKFKLRKNGRYTFSCGANVTSKITMEVGDGFTVYLSLFENKDASISGYVYPAQYSDNVSFTADYEYAYVTIRISRNSVIDNVVIKPQLELGSTATPYEPYHGSTTTITPDSNPYTIPNDIRQLEGHNVISVSAGELSVVGVKENLALKKVWDKLDELATAIIVSNGEI